MSHPAHFAADREIRDLRLELRRADLRLRKSDIKRLDDLRNGDTASVDRRFHAAETAILAAVTSAERAISHADAGVDKRFDGVNDKIDALTKTLVSRLDLLSTASDLGEGRRTGRLDTRTFLFALIGLAVSVIVAVTFIIGLHL